MHHRDGRATNPTSATTGTPPTYRAHARQSVSQSPKAGGWVPTQVRWRRAEGLLYVYTRN